MLPRRAFLLADVMGALSALAVTLVLATVSVHERMRAQAAADASARLEIAQNLLAAARHGEAPALPAGWTVTRSACGQDLTAITVSGAGVSLSTMVPPGESK